MLAREVVLSDRCLVWSRVGILGDNNNKTVSPFPPRLTAAHVAARWVAKVTKPVIPGIIPTWKSVAFHVPGSHSGLLWHMTHT